MKHSTFLKFIAVILCAASLLTLVGSGLGIFCMVELDLYDKTVDQFLADKYYNTASYYARSMAQRYASENLGGCPEELAFNQYDYGFDSRFEEGGVGYAILDEEGNVLTSSNEYIKNDDHQLFRFPVEGNYMHMVYSEPVQDLEVVITSDGLAEGEYGIIDNLGTGSREVFSITITTQDGSEGIGSIEPLGELIRLEDGSIQFQGIDGFHFGYTQQMPVTRIRFEDADGGLIYEAAGETPVAYIFSGLGGDQITFQDPDADSETPVYQAIFYGADGEEPIETLKGTQPIGAARLDEEGHLNFQLYVESSKLKEANGVYSLVLMDQDGTVLFGEALPQLRTDAQVATSDGLHFSSHPDAIAMALPVQATPETVPEEVDTGSGEATPAEADASAAEDTEPGQEPAERSEEEGAENTIPEETVPEVAEAQSETIPETVPETTAAATVPETLPEAATTAIPDYRDMEVNGKSVREYQIDTFNYYDTDTQQRMQAKVIYVAMPAYTVEVFLRPDLDSNAFVYSLLTLLRQYRFLLLPALLGSLLVLALTTVYLCVAAGHKRKTAEIRAGGLNRMPLDLYFLLDGAAITALGALIMVACTDLLPRNLMVGMVLIPLMAYAICLLIVGFCFALVAQCKTPGGYWWRNTVTVRLIAGSFHSLEKLGHWTRHKGLPWLGLGICKLWDILCLLGERLKIYVKSFLGWVFCLIQRFLALLPLTWQWVLGGLVLLGTGVLAFANRHDGWGFLWLLAGIALVLYVSHCFGLLLERTKKMNQGDLESKIDDKRMVGCFREFAVDLNSLADVVVVAAQKQLRSERMKTELITNVSHDIKTPLTSIINYVDLLQKPHTEQEGKEYLEVLDRQSQRLKKLIDDLMDMSKANTGNMHVEITRLDAVESVNQALGEFADKLEKAELTPVFRHNTPEAYILADGKLVWRVLSNLLSNAVKYAMPGTRLYLDLMNLDGRVILSLKNISREELNVDAEELMERFVRGDDSRNTEGSGLGLNIAKSLMELQKGHLQLLVDGDLFKVTLVFPTAQ